MAPRVSLFATCIVDQLFPEVGIAMTEVLERAGCQVGFPERQTCCGQPAFNTGFREEAKTVARYFLSVFENADFIVVPSGSCTTMITHHFEELFEKEDEALAQVERMRPRGGAAGVGRQVMFSCNNRVGGAVSLRHGGEK